MQVLPLWKESSLENGISLLYEEKGKYVSFTFSRVMASNGFRQFLVDRF